MWWQDTGATHADWEEFRTGFINKFDNAALVSRLMVKFRCENKKSDEAVGQCIQRKQLLYNRLYPGQT